MKTGIIDVGGGTRAVFAAGVEDYLLENNIGFDEGIGISAGAGNLSSFIAGQRFRNLFYYLDYTFRDEYMGYKNLLTKGEFVDLNYAFNEIASKGGEYPLDYERFVNNPMGFEAVALNMRTGKPHYFDKSDIKEDDFRPFMASASLPFVSRPVEIDHRLFMDGGFADPVPIDRLFSKGVDKGVLILSKRIDHVRSQKDDRWRYLYLKRKYPQAAHAVKLRAHRYNESLKRAKALQEEGKLLIVAPDDLSGVGTLTKDRDAFMDLYLQGYRKGPMIAEYLRQK